MVKHLRAMTSSTCAKARIACSLMQSMAIPRGFRAPAHLRRRSRQDASDLRLLASARRTGFAKFCCRGAARVEHHAGESDPSIPEMVTRSASSDRQRCHRHHGGGGGAART